MESAISIRFENIERRLAASEKGQEKCMEDLWREVNRLKDSHNGHDLVIQKLALSIEVMGKELSKSVQELSSSLGTHLQEEERERKETLNALRGIGSRVVTGVLTSMIVGAGAVIWAVVTTH